MQVRFSRAISQCFAYSLLLAIGFPYTSGCASVLVVTPTWGTARYQIVVEELKPKAESQLSKALNDRSRNAGQLILDYAAASLAVGDIPGAQRAFYEAILLTNDLTLGATAGNLSLVFDEALKVWQGEAYERAMIEFLHGICLMRLGDFDNARVAFDRAIATDRFSMGAIEGMEGSTQKKRFVRNETTQRAGSVHQRDFLAAYILRTLCYVQSGRIERARKSWAQAQEIGREITRLAKQTRAAGSIVTWTGDDGRYRFPSIYISPLQSAVSVEDGALLQSFDEVRTVNLVTVFASGSRPRKVRTGRATLGGKPKLVHDTYLPAAEQIWSGGIMVDGRYRGMMTSYLDLYGQASGRGPSAKDRAQRRKEVVETIGEALAEHGSFGLQYVGLFIQVINREEADTRQWGLLPNRIHLWLGRVDPGRRRVACLPSGQNLPSMEPLVAGLLSSQVQAIEYSFAQRHGMPEVGRSGVAARHFLFQDVAVADEGLAVLFFAEDFNANVKRVASVAPQRHELLPRRTPTKN